MIYRTRKNRIGLALPIRARLEDRGELFPDADLQIAATAVRHGLALVTGNLKHFSRVPGLDLSDVFAVSRR